MIKNFKYYIFRFTIIVLGIFLVVSTYMFFNQKNFVYFPDNQDFDSCAGFADSEKIRMDGTRAYYLKAEEADSILVYYHGNAGSACDRAFVKDILKNHGISLLFVEYAGYSGDSKKPSKKLILKDVENVDKFIYLQKYKKTILMGTSLGSSLAAYHQTLRTPDKMIMISPFDKLSQVAKVHYPFLPVSLLLREEYETIKYLEDYTNEIIIIHGSEDEIIPIELARRLYDVIPSSEKRFITINNATHNNLLFWPGVFEAVTEFLK